MRLKIMIATILILAGANVKAEGHQPLQVDFNRMIEDVNRDGASLHDQVSRHIQNIEAEQQWDKNDEAATAAKKQRKVVNAEDSDVQ